MNFRTILSVAVLAVGCAAPSSSESRTSEEASVAKGAPEIHTVTSDANGFDTHSFWIDTGAEVVVFDAQFTPAYAQKVVEDITSKTRSPIAFVVVTHPNPDKFQGAPVFQALGARVVASKATADAMPGVWTYKKGYFTNVAKSFTAETYPALPKIDQTFEGSYALPLRGALRIELRELASPGVSSTQTVAYVPDARALFVGDLVHEKAHAWLEGGIVDGAPKPTLDGWKDDLDEIAAAYPNETIVYGGRGTAARLPIAVADEKAYLDGMKALVTKELAAHDHPVETLASPDAGALYTKIQNEAAAAYPEYELSYMIGYGVYGLAQQIAAELEER